MKILVRDYTDANHDACCKLWGELAERHAEIYEYPSIAAGDTGKYLHRKGSGSSVYRCTAEELVY